MALAAHQRGILFGFIFALAMGLAACGGDASDADQDSGQNGSNANPDNDAGYDDGRSPNGEQDQLIVSPNPVTFEPLPIGAESTVDVTITNVGRATLHITNITLEEDPDDADEEFFIRGEGWGTQNLALASGDTHQVTVRYRPVNQVLDTGSIIIESDDPTNPQNRVPVSALGVQVPEIYSPTPISFAKVAPTATGERGDWRMTQVWNTGEVPLRISQIRTQNNNSPFSFSIPQPTAAELAHGVSPSPNNDSMTWPSWIEPNERVDVRVWFAPTNRDPAEDKLIFMSNAPASPEYSVNLFGNSVERCVEVSPADAVDFGLRSIGMAHQKTITLKNCSPTAAVTVETIENTDDAGGVFGFDADSLPEDELTLDPLQSSELVLNFSPTEVDDYIGSVRITTNDLSNADIELPILAQSTHNKCPTALATATILDDITSVPSTEVQATPQNTIQFDATGSSDPDGSVARYEWTILSSPVASSATFSDADAESPTLEIDVYGEYRVELKVYDDEDMESCGEPAIITISTHTNDDISIQLTWVTQSDVQRQDLDLHYKHPNASRWASSGDGWSCYFGNRSPDWGIPGYSPTMDQDDTSGPGPEIISHMNLENVSYQIGAKFYSDHGNGPVFATFEIYRRDVLIYTAVDKHLTSGQFWLMGALNGATQTVEPIDTVIESGFPTVNP